MKYVANLIGMAFCLAALVNCGKTEFNRAPDNVPVEVPNSAPPGDLSTQRVWSSPESLGTIGIYIGSAQKYGSVNPPVPGSACTEPNGTVYDLRSCAPNGQLCTSAGRPLDQYLCCTDLVYYDCR